ncbi:MAG: extracellular solute-binding protein [Spirochaetales bacterium]|nr:extracellular solute-binding protein [Spirochaetales bacterium]
MKKTLSFFLALLILLSISSLVFAGGQKEGEKAGPITIQCWTSPQWKGVYDPGKPNAKNGDFLRFAAKKYKELHPDINIEVAVIPGRQRAEKINTNLAAGTPPDTFFDASFVLTDWAHSGALVPVDDIITKDMKDDIPTSIINLCKIAGKTFVVPFSQSSAYLKINADLFRKAGADQFIPKDLIGAWTIDEFYKALKAVSGHNDFYPFGLYCGSAQGDTWNNMYLRMFGAKFFSDDHSRVVINNPLGVKALQWLVNLQNEGLTEPGVTTHVATEVNGMFQNKKIAVSFGNYANFMRDMSALKRGEIKPPFDVRLVMIPGTPHPNVFTYLYGTIVFDTGNARRIAAAKDFVKFYSSSPYTKASLIFVPIRKSIIKQATNPYYKAIDKTMKYVIDFTGGVPGYLQLRGLLFPALQAAFTGEMTAKQALDDFATKANETLKKNVSKSVLLNK